MARRKSPAVRPLPRRSVPRRPSPARRTWRRSVHDRGTGRGEREGRERGPVGRPQHAEPGAEVFLPLTPVIDTYRPTDVSWQRQQGAVEVEVGEKSKDGNEGLRRSGAQDMGKGRVVYLRVHGDEGLHRGLDRGLDRG